MEIISSLPEFYSNGPNRHNNGDDAHSSHWSGLSTYSGYPHPVPTNNISTPQEWRRQTPLDYPTHLLTNTIAYNGPVLSPGVSQPSAVGEIASSSHISLQQQLLDPMKSKSAPSRGKLTDHEPIKSAKPNQCLQCLHCFHTMAQLNLHCKDSKHVAFKCKCGATFGRSADLGRHLAPYQSTNHPAFPCSLCIHRRGKDGFWRKDHLAQHLCTYHRVTYENTSVEDATPMVHASPRTGHSNNGCLREPAAGFDLRM